MSFKLSSCLPTNNWVRFLFAPVLVFIATSVDRNYQTDFWHHLARGQAMAEQGKIVNQDLFSYTVAGVSFQDANWLSQLIYSYLYQAGGLPLIQFVNSLVLSVVMAVVVGLCVRSSKSFVASAGMGIFSFLGLWQLLIIRPQTFSLLLFVVIYAVLEFAKNRRLLLVLPPLIMALWANMHGGFPIGLVLVGSYGLAALWESCVSRRMCFWQDKELISLSVCMVACFLATFVNPYGWNVYRYVGVTSSVANARRIDEWLPPGLLLFVGKIWVISVLMVVLLFALPGRRPKVSEVSLVLCFLPFSCGSIRMAAWWLLIIAPISAGLLMANVRRYWPQNEYTERPNWGAALTVLALIGAAIVCVPSLEQHNPVLNLLGRTKRTEDDLERLAVRLRQHEPGNIFSRFEWGEYLGWSLAPDYKIFMDGRIEIYPDQVWQDFSAITRGRADWEDILDRYKVDYLVLDSSGFNADLLPQVRESAVWIEEETAGSAVLFRRRSNTQAMVRTHQH
jgi:hypothetical protein